MTQDEIIEMARQAGGMFSELPMMDAWVFDDIDKSLEVFAKLVAQHEREACALIGNSMDACQDGAIGEAIRARGQT
jgi:hypothetical protein